MPNTVIDTLEVKITANALTAAKALDSLANSLKNVRAVLNNTNKAGASIGDKLAKNIHELNNAMTRINNDGIKKLQFMANALNSYANAVQKAKAAGGLNSVAKNIQKVSEATSVKTDMADQPGGSGAADKNRDPLDGVGLNDPIDAKWKKVHEKTSAITKFLKSVGRIAMYRAIRNALKAISEAFNEGLENAYAYSKQSENFKELAETLDRVKTATYQMTNQLGAFWGEIKQLVAPVIEWLVEKLRQISERLTELFSALNGKSTYLRAKQVAKSWGEATDNVKAFKQQLLGLDELNNLTTQTGKDKDTTDPADMYEEVEISSKIKNIADGYNTLKQKLSDIFNDYRGTLLVGIGLLVIGAIFTFFTTKKLLGLGLMLSSGLLIGKTVMENKEQLYNDVQSAMQKYRWLFVAGAIGLTAIGAALLFTGHWKLGLGCVLSGVAIGATAVIMSWDLMYNDIQSAMQNYRWLFIAGAIGLTVLGAALLFTGHFALGIGCILGGVSLGVSEIAMNWELLYNDLQNAFQQFAPYIALGGLASMVAGIILLFTGNLPLGLGLLFFGGFLESETISVNWDEILDNLQQAWHKITNWWNNTVVVKIKNAIKWLEEKTGIDWNGDGFIGDGGGGSHTSGNGGEHGGGGHSRGGSTTTATTTSSDLSSYPKLVKNYNEYVDEMHKTLADAWENRNAMGGLNRPGTLFYAGEAGPEYIGRMGNSAAVANTSQMTDAIYKAAYMGMSQALKENGGNGLAGFEPASTDDLFIAMRRKSAKYNKTTGKTSFA